MIAADHFSADFVSIGKEALIPRQQVLEKGLTVTMIYSSLADDISSLVLKRRKKSSRFPS